MSENPADDQGADRGTDMLNLPGNIPQMRAPSVGLARLAVGLIGFGILLMLLAGSYVIVQPTEMAGKRRLGQVVTDLPLGPGLHLKLPLIDTIDKIQVSLETYRIDHLSVNTIDNQPIAVAVGLTYRIPSTAVLKLLYEVGRAGNFDIGDNFNRIIADRTAKIFAQQNTTTISENRERLSSSLRALLGTDLAKLYGIEVIDFQIAQISYSDSFRASVEAAVKAKNEAVAAENTVNRIRFEAQQAVARANGEAEAKLKIADADRQSAILAAQGRAEGVRLEGQSRANVLQLYAGILRDNPAVVDLVRADRWNGTLPATLLQGAGSVPLISLPAGAPAAVK
jgi:regulator of protease activity HflC (stomatin/prohibitin superfamily)